MLKIYILILLFFSLSVFAKQKEWTFVILMNGDNDLCQSAKADIKELRYKNVSDIANFIIVYDCEEENDSKILEIRGKWRTPKDITKAYSDLKEFDMGDALFLSGITIDIFKAYPSKQRMLIVWDHGWGWDDGIKEARKTKGISYDFQSNNFITTAQLVELVKTVSEQAYLDIIGFDACLMQMAEIIYAIAPYTTYIIGSEETEPTTGWNYKDLVDLFYQYENINSLAIGKILVSGYYYSTYNNRLTLSMVDTNRFKAFVQTLPDMVKRMQGLDMMPYIKATPGFRNPDYKDMGYFIKQLPNTEYEYSLYLNSIIYHRATIDSSGISVYLPLGIWNHAYLDLKFVQDTQWNILFP